MSGITARCWGLEDGAEHPASAELHQHADSAQTQLEKKGTRVLGGQALQLRGGGAHAKAQQHAFFGKRSQVKVQEGKWGQVKKKKTFKTKCEAGHGADQEIQEGKWQVTSKFMFEKSSMNWEGEKGQRLLEQTK